MARITDLPAELHREIVHHCVARTVKQIARNKLRYYTLEPCPQNVDKTPFYVSRVCGAWNEYVTRELIGDQTISDQRKTTLLAKLDDYKKACTDAPAEQKRIAALKSRIARCEARLSTFEPKLATFIHRRKAWCMGPARSRLCRDRVRELTSEIGKLKAQILADKSAIDTAAETQT